MTTQSVRRGASNKPLKAIVSHGRIFDAYSDEPWVVDGAAVRVSLVCFGSKQEGPCHLDGDEVGTIAADLTATADVTEACALVVNKGVTFQGTIKTGPFEIDGTRARRLLSSPVNPNGRPNSDVVRPWSNGDDVTDRPNDFWIIDFGTLMTRDYASLYEEPFELLRARIGEENAARSARGEPILRAGEPRSLANWWLHQRPRPPMRKALQRLARYFVTPRVSKYRLFVWRDRTVLPDTRLVVFARDDDTTFGIVHSRFHEIWSLRLGGRHGVGNDPQYTPSLGFETFPFPEGLTPDIPAADYASDPRAQAIAAAAAELNRLREAWLNPEDLVMRVPEVVPGYPDRILPKDEAAAAVLKKRTLTNLYNQRPAWLDHAHARLDAVVAEAYGWGEDWRAGRLGEAEILARLFALNQERAGQARAG